MCNTNETEKREEEEEEKTLNTSRPRQFDSQTDEFQMSFHVIEKHKKTLKKQKSTSN